MSKKKKKFYAYRLEDGATDIVGSWPDCEAVVSGRNARYRGFATRAEAQAWLDRGAPYQEKVRELPDDLPEDAVFFDAGTGGGKGTRARVTDRDGVPLAHLAADHDALDPEGNVLLPGKTNNYGELFACLLGLQVARSLGSRTLCGDSKLVLTFWSQGRLGKAAAGRSDLEELAARTAAERQAFEADGGVLRRIPGGVNPADLGYHRD